MASFASNHVKGTHDLEPQHTTQSMYIREITSPDLESLPIVDLTQWENDPTSVCESLRSACTSYGFMYVRTSCLDYDLFQNDILPGCTKYFALSEDIKMKQPCTPSRPLGYTPMEVQGLNVERGPDCKESLVVGDASFLEDESSSFPDELKKWPAQLRQFTSQLRQTSTILQRAYALSLGKSENWLTEKHNECELSTARIQHYPASQKLHTMDEAKATHTETAIQVRAGEHTDFGTFTLLCLSPDDCGGLQVLSPYTKNWLNIGHRKGCIVVNTGDLLMHWTNGQYLSTVHRVIVSKQSRQYNRISLAYFALPDPTVKVIPFSTNTGKSSAQLETSAKYEHDTNENALTVQEFITRRRMATKSFKPGMQI